MAKMTGRPRIDRCMVGKRPDRSGKLQRRGRIALHMGKMSTGPGKTSMGSGKEHRRSIGTSMRSGTKRHRAPGNRKPGSTTVVGTVRSCTIVAVVGTVGMSLKNESESIILSYRYELQGKKCCFLHLLYLISVLIF